MITTDNSNINYPVHPLFKQRWSSRSFEANKPISKEDIDGLIEAARWAPSSFNDQPWRFLLTHKGEERYDLVTNSLAEFNQLWAPNAPTYIVVAGETNRANGAPNTAYHYDTGQAVAYLTIEATHRNLMVHQMGGFDKLKLRSDLKLPEGIDILVVIAIGYYQYNENLNEPIKSLELTERTRKSQQEIIL